MLASDDTHLPYSSSSSSSFNSSSNPQRKENNSTKVQKDTKAQKQHITLAEASSTQERGEAHSCLIPPTVSSFIPSHPSSTSLASERGGSIEPSKVLGSGREKHAYAIPFSGSWVLQRLREGTSRSLGVLHNWVHQKRICEATCETMQEVSKLADEAALEALRELAGPKKFIHGHKGNQMDVTITVTTLDNQKAITTQALVDCGCTGSSIDMGFVSRHGLETRKVARPIPVYNADGTLNSGGPIAEFVDLHVQIQGHKERMSLAVTNLGKTDIFLGYEWLKFHNPIVIP